MWHFCFIDKDGVLKEKNFDFLSDGLLFCFDFAVTLMCIYQDAFLDVLEEESSKGD